MEYSGVGGADGQYDHTVELESLKGRIMADIEAKLSQKEESLWRRGQVEIRRLQIEQQQVTQQIGKMQEQQAALNTENQKIKGVLLEVTSKFERVVNEMREVLRALPQRSGGDRPSPSPSVASTSASEAAGDDKSFEHPSEQNSILTATEPSGLWSVDRSRRQVQTPVTPTPVPMWHTQGPGEGLAELPSFDPEDIAGAVDNRTFCTPPRTSPSQEDAALQIDPAVVAPPPPASWHLPAVASPAPAVLSLANALPSASQASAPSPGFKRLHLAEHIEQAKAGATPPTAARQSDSSSAAVAGGHAIAAVAKQPDLINIELAKEPGFVTLGMEVKQIDDFSLRIERIDEHGLVGHYNARQDLETSKVQVGDRIVEANGIRQDPQRMLQECKVRQRLLFTLLREEEGQGVVKAGGVWDSAGLVDVNEVGSPSSTRLRPEARVFVPSAQKEAAPAPPGLEGYEAAAQGVEPAVLGEMHGHVSLADQEEVKRALFP